MQQIGRYEILHEIGRGAMGVVFKGRDPLIGRAVAIKTITAGVAENADLLERFYREARAAGGLQHPNIVTIFEMAESGGSPFIAMEYLEGESLEKLIGQKREQSLKARIDYVVQAARALHYAHSHGVIHRDIKPANIVLTRDGIVKVVDFGIARLADASKTQTGMLLGTLAYMSPEQLRGQHADARCDIWALGVVLYELISYQRPFTGENHAALLLSILQNEPRSMRQIIPECPIELERVVSAALCKVDKERYPTMEALLKDLERVSASLGRNQVDPATEKEILASIGKETLAATQRIDVQSSNSPKPVRGAKPDAQAPGAVAQQSKTLTPTERSANATSPARTDRPGIRAARQPAQLQSRSTLQPKVRRRRAVTAMYAILAMVLLAALAVVRHHRISTGAVNRDANLNLILPPLNPTAKNSAAETSSAAPNALPTSEVATKVETPVAEPLAPSAEDQQRHLIDLAHEAADRHDYKAAQARLDDATRLNGPLNGLVSDLRRRFSAEAHGAEMQRAARREQTLWDQAMADLQGGLIDDADKSLRAILTLPEGGHRWADAEHYVDYVIPQRRQDDQLWAEAQLDSSSNEAGHLLKEIKALDDILARGGPHEQQARQTRNTVITQMVRGNARRNRAALPVVSTGDEAQITQLENQFRGLVQKGDAVALEQLQQLRPKFKVLAETGGPLAMDARDYINNLIPKAQKHIEDNLAAAESEAPANAAYQKAVKEYDRAVATQNKAMLRDQVLPSFQQIAQSGGVRAKEAEQYVGVLIPGTLQKSGQRE